MNNHYVTEKRELSQSSASESFVSVFFQELSTLPNRVSSYASLLKLESQEWSLQKKSQYLNNLQTVVEQLEQLMNENFWVNETENDEDSQPERELKKLLPPFKNFFPQSWRLNSQLKPVFDFIEANYNQQINVSNVATAVGYSQAYLSNLVKQQTGRTIHNWIVERRMTEARTLLRKTDRSVTQIAAAVGYPDTGHFIRQFRLLYNITPKMWRNTNRTSLQHSTSFACFESLN
jgi:AraC-like DNA-binding protein